MKSIIIYFSQTGNTEKIAKAIQTGIKQTTGSCDLVEIRQANPNSLKEYDLIGLGSMVMGAAPDNVLEFAGKLRFVGGKHAFTFCTHGTSYKYFYPSLYPILKSKGLVMIGAADWYGDCSLLHMLQPYPTAGHPDEIDFQEAEAFGRDTVMRSWKIAAGETGLILPPAEPPPPPPKPAAGSTPPGGKSMMDIIGAFAEWLKFDKKKCLYPNCTLCMDNCPTYGIDLTVDPPVLAKPCLSCEFCARVCPTGALDMNPWLEAMADMSYGSPKPANKPASSENRFLTALEKDEATGHFRRLLPVEDVGKVPGYKLYKTHPQWIIGKGPNL